MSVVSSGFKGYEYQHIASLYMALRYISEYEVVSITIDAPGTEDCQIQFQEKGKAQLQVAEIQCKNHTASLEAEKFAEIITHFESRSADTNLLSKLADGRVNKVHLIYRGRAADFAARLNILPDSQTPDGKAIRPVARKYLKELSKGIMNVLVGSTTSLSIKRHQFNQQLAKRMTRDNVLFRQVLQNILVSDQLPQVTAEEKIRALLKQFFKVTDTGIEKCFTKLASLVKTNADSPVNILPGVNRILSNYKSGAISIAGDYIFRGDEEDFLQILREKRILLLTGSSRCGKTQLAKKIASKLLEATGIAYLQTSDIDEANRYLSDSTAGEKLCMLEDPFGQYPEDVNLMRYKNFENLLSNLPQDHVRYFIVTTRKEVVEYSSITGYLEWMVVTVTDRTFLKTLWEQLVEQSGLDPKLKNTVLSFLETDLPNDLLQPGELSFLARNSGQLMSKDPESIRHFARSNAQDIARLVGRNKAPYIQLFTILGLTASTLNGPCMNDLQYLLGNDEDYLPGIFQPRAISYGGSSKQDDEPYRIPDYHSLSPLSGEMTEALEDLIEKGYIVENDNFYLFSHPVYQESARSFLKHSAGSAVRRNLSYARHSIAALNPAIALNTLKSLHIFLGYHLAIADRVKEIIAIAFKAHKSIFRSVQDSSQMFILNNYDLLDKEQREAVHEWLTRGYGYTYYWDDGIAFVTQVADRRYIPDLKARFMTEEEFQERSKAYSEGQDRSPRNAWLVVHYMEMKARHRKARVDYDPEFLSSFLSYNESFIRESAAYLLAASLTPPYFSKLERLLQLQDPLVVFQLIKGAVRAYPYLENENDRVQLLGMLLDAYNSPVVVIRSIPFMTQYDSGHSSNTFDWRDDIAAEAVPAMWEVWGEMMPVFFKNLSPVTYINEGRFSGALYESCTLVSKTQQYKILSSWVSWVELQSGLSFSNPFVHALVEHFLRLFEDLSSEQRLDIIGRLLKLPYRRLVAQLVNDLVCRYAHLETEERIVFSEFLSQSGEAIQNIALVSKGAEQGVQEILTGHAQLSVLSTPELAGILSEDRFKECLLLLFPPYNYCELDHPDQTGWRKHLLYFLDHPNHPLFLLAINRLIHEYQYLPDPPEDLKTSRKALLTSIFKGQARNSLETIFNLLVTRLIEPSRWPIKLLLIFFFSSIPQGEADYFGKRLCYCIEAITYSNSIEQLPKSVYSRFLAPLLKGEDIIRRVIELSQVQLSEGRTPDTAATALIETILNSGNLRDYEVADDLSILAGNYPRAFSESFVDRVNVTRNSIFSKYEAQAKQLQEKIDEKWLNQMPNTL